MRLFRVVLGFGVLGLSLAGFVGCQEDNEAKSKINSVAGGGNAGPKPKTQNEYFQQQKKPSELYGGDYAKQNSTSKK